MSAVVQAPDRRSARARQADETADEWHRRQAELKAQRLESEAEKTAPAGGAS